MKTPNIDKLTDEQRQAILDCQRGVWMNHVVGYTMGVIVVAVSFVVAGLGYFGCLYAGLAMFDSDPMTLYPFALFLNFGVFAILFLSWIRFDHYLDDRTVRVFLRRHNENGRVNLCPFCRYNLHGSVSDTCPECGEEVIVVVFDEPPDDSQPLPGDETHAP